MEIISDKSNSIPSPASIIKQQAIIDDEIESIGDGPFHLYMSLILGLGNAADAAEVLCIGYILTTFVSQHGELSSFQEGSITGGVFAGMFVGGILFGYLSDHIGRKRALLTSLCINGIAALLASLSWSIFSLIIFRIIAGIGVGGTVPSMFTLCTEHLPIKNRGYYITIVASFWMLGSIFVALMAWIIFHDINESSSFKWRLFAMIVSLPSFGCFILSYYYVPESPRYLVSRGNYHQALHVLQYIRKRNRSSEIDENQPLYPDTGLKVKDKNEKDIIYEENTFFHWKSINIRLRDIFKPVIIQTTISLMISWFCLSFGSYGITTRISLIFKRIGFINPYQNAFLFAFANLPGNLASVYLVDVIGRKYLLLFSMCFASLCAIGFGLVSSGTSSFSIVLFACLFNAFSISGWNALDVLSTESFPTDVRTQAMGLLSGSGRIGSMTAQFVNSFLVKYSTIDKLLYVTACIMIIGVLAITSLKIEPRGRQLLRSISQMK